MLSLLVLVRKCWNTQTEKLSCVVAICPPLKKPTYLFHTLIDENISNMILQWGKRQGDIFHSYHKLTSNIRYAIHIFIWLTSGGLEAPGRGWTPPHLCSEDPNELSGARWIATASFSVIFSPFLMINISGVCPSLWVCILACYCSSNSSNWFVNIIASLSGQSSTRKVKSLQSGGDLLAIPLPVNTLQLHHNIQLAILDVPLGMLVDKQ